MGAQPIERLAPDAERAPARELLREPLDEERDVLEALETVRANKVRYARAEAKARSRNPARPPYFTLPTPDVMMDEEGHTVHIVATEMTLESQSGRP